MKHLYTIKTINTSLSLHNHHFDGGTCHTMALVFLYPCQWWLPLDHSIDCHVAFNPSPLLNCCPNHCFIWVKRCNLLVLNLIFNADLNLWRKYCDHVYKMKEGKPEGKAMFIFIYSALFFVIIEEYSMMFKWVFPDSMN